MERYKNLSGNSGVTHYTIGEDFIEIKFKEKEEIYIYRNSRCSKQHIDRMKRLALSGRGLAAYIAKHPEVRNNFDLR